MKTKTNLLARRACLWASLELLAVVAGEPHPAQAAVTEAWVQRYNGPTNSDDQAQAVAVDGGGNVVVTGYSASRDNYGESPPYRYPVYDYYTAKYAALDGALLWEKRYNGPADGYDRAQAVAVDGSGNVVVTGYSDNGTNDDYYTAKYAAADGALLWEKRYNGPADGYDQAQALAVDNSGNVAVTGYSFNGTNNDYYTAKYAAADGVLLWEQRYNGPANNQDDARAVAVDASGNVVVTGLSHSDYYTAKYAAADGALLWEKRYIGGYAIAVAVDRGGNVVVTGFSYPDYYTTKYAAADGALIWAKRSNNRANCCDQAEAVAVDGSGNVVVTGSSVGNDSYWHYYTAKYAAADGVLLWEKHYKGPTNSQGFARAVAVDSSGNAVVTGSSWNETNADYYTAKYAAADGVLLWEKRYNGPANGNDIMRPLEFSGGNSHNLALGPKGTVAITGTSQGNFGSGTSSDYATVVYRENLPSVSIALVPTGTRLRSIGLSGHSYTIERAPAVTGPWTAINTQTSPPSGLLQYLDPTPHPDSAFYRTVQP